MSLVNPEMQLLNTEFFITNKLNIFFDGLRDFKFAITLLLKQEQKKKNIAMIKINVISFV